MSESNSVVDREPHLVRSRRDAIATAIFACILSIIGPQSRCLAAEAAELRIAKGFGITYLPLIVAAEQKLIEKELVSAELPNVRVTWSNFSGGTAMNDGLLSDQIDIANGGIGPLITLWAKTRRNYDIRGIMQVSIIPIYLNASRPGLQTLDDFTDADRIAVPAVKTSLQAVLLQMAARSHFGRDHFDRLDRLEVPMSPPDSHIAIMSGMSSITATFTTPPFLYEEIKSGKAHKVITSTEILGGPATVVVAYAKTKFHDEQPKLFNAFKAGVTAAMETIRTNPDLAASLYIKHESSKLTVTAVKEMIVDPETIFDPLPRQCMQFAEFMAETGSIKEKPNSWKDLFFPEIHDLPGS